MSGANGGGPRAAEREVITGQNWSDWLHGFFLFGALADGDRFHLFFPHFSALFRVLSARRANLPGDRELEEARRSPWGRAGWAEQCRFMRRLYNNATHFVKGKNAGCSGAGPGLTRMPTRGRLEASSRRDNNRPRTT
jgi:hypothetical protein